MNLIRKHVTALSLFFGITLLVIVASAEITLTDDGSRGGRDNSYMEDADYMGSETCRLCHPEKYEQWAQSQHTEEFRPVSEAIVLGDFSSDPQLDDVKAGIPQLTIDLYHEAGTDVFTMELAGNNYTIDWVLGSGTWKQRYLTNIENSTYILPAQWNVSAGEWGAYQLADWFETDGNPREVDWGFGSEPLKQVEMDKSWQRNCAGCHTTRYLPMQNANDEWVDNYVEADIGCEACHGPGSEHVGAPWAEKKEYILKSGDSQICAQCHVQGKSLDGEHYFPVGMYPGDDITDHYNLSNDVFWPDGITAREHRSQYMDWTTSGHAQEPSASVKRAPCVNCHTTEGAQTIFAGEILTTVPEGVTWRITCAACHEPHGSSYEADLRTQKKDLCATCHNAEGSVLPSTPHYPRYDIITGTGGVGIIGDLLMGGVVSCTDCHMPNVANESFEWEVASHTFSPIQPGEGIEFSMPNSCTANCHDGEGPGYLMSAETAAMVIETWHEEIDDMLEYVGDNMSIAQEEILLAKFQGKDDSIINEAEDTYSIAAANYDYVAHETSRGVHNFNYARTLLFDSFQKTQQIMKLLDVMPPENQAPQAWAGDTMVAEIGESIIFNASRSYDPEESNLTYHWDFGDSTTAEGMTHTHTYDEKGMFQVSLVVTDPAGLTDTDSVTVYVIDIDTHGWEGLEDKTEALDEEMANKANQDDLDSKIGMGVAFGVLCIALVAVVASYLTTKQELEYLKDEVSRLDPKLSEGDDKGHN